LGGVIERTQLIGNLRHLGGDVEEAPAENLARLLFRAEPVCGLFVWAGEAQPLTLRFDEPSRLVLVPDAILKKARIHASPTLGSDEPIERFVADSVLLSLYAD
jgi:hypothetical protein